LCCSADVDAVGAQSFGDQCARARLLVGQQPVGDLDERDLLAGARERLRELASDRSAAEHDEPAGQLAQVPDRVGRQRLGVRELAAVTTGAVRFAKPAGSPRLRSVIRVAPSSASYQV
jgi:hypothetical protein